MVSTEAMIPWEKLKTGMFMKAKDGTVYRVHDVYVNCGYAYIQPTGGYNQLIYKDGFMTFKFTRLSRNELLTAQRGFIQTKINSGNLHYNIRCYIGCDPEIFVTNRDGEVVPAWTFLLGKSDPKRTSSNPYWDGFQAEFNTTPDTCMGYMGDRLHNNLTELYNSRPTGTHLSHQSVLQVSGEELATAKPEHVSLGCLPSLNAYGDSGLQVPDPRMLPFRFAGGHIHIGGVTGTYSDIRKAPKRYVKAIDACLGMASVALFDGLDVPIRRQYYGLAGEYRLPEHGLEYRVLSNAWLTHPALAHWAFDICRSSFTFAGKLKHWFNNYSEERIRKTINSGDAGDARKWIKENQALYNALALSHHGEEAIPVINHMYQNGATSLVDVKSVAQNWCITGANNWIGHSEGRNCNLTHFSQSHFDALAEVV